MVKWGFSVPEFVSDFLERLAAGGYSLTAIGVELLLIGLVVYSVLRFLHGTRGARLMQGLFFLMVAGFLVVRLLADTFDWTRIRVLYRYFVFGVFLTTLVVFQPELRRGLMRIGETRWLRRYLGARPTVVEPIVQAVTHLAKNKIGALIAIEREVGLAGLAESGIRIDAKLSSELLQTIFWPGSALHDMGVIIQSDRIVAAGCQFPLSHESDALVVIVSEETGTISVADGGTLSRHLAPEDLARLLGQSLNLADSTGNDRMAA